MAVGINDVVVEQLTLTIEDDGFATGAETWVEGKDGALAERGGEEEFADVFGEDLDGVGVGLLFGFEAELGFHRGSEQALEGVGQHEAQLRGGGGCSIFDDVALEFGEGEGLVDGDAHHQEEFLFAATHGEQAVRRALGERLGPLEVVFEFGGLGFLARDDLGGNDRGFAVEPAEVFAGGGVIAHALGEDVAGAGEGLVGGGDFGNDVFAVVGGVFTAHIRGGRGGEIDGGVLRPDLVGERLDALFFGDGGAGALLRAERQVDVLEADEGLGVGDLGGERVGEEVALLEGGEDGGSAFVEGGELFEAVADGGDLDLVEFAGHLFAVTGDEGDGGALFEELRGRGDLVNFDVSEFLDDAQDVFGVGEGSGFGHEEKEGTSATARGRRARLLKSAKNLIRRGQVPAFRGVGFGPRCRDERLVLRPRSSCRFRGRVCAYGRPGG